EASGELEFKDNAPTDKGCGKVMITVTTSEAMKNVSIEITTLSFTKNNTTPVANSDGKVWEFEVLEDKTKDAAEGPHAVLIDGKDLAGNALQGFTSKNKIAGADLQKKKLDGTFVPNTAPVKDKVHTFSLLSLKDKITVATTPVTGCKIDGTATITVT